MEISLSRGMPAAQRKRMLWGGYQVLMPATTVASIKARKTMGNRAGLNVSSKSESDGVAILGRFAEVFQESRVAEQSAP